MSRAEHSPNNPENKIVDFPHEIKSVGAELNAQLLKDFTGEKSGFIQVGNKNWFFPIGYQNQAKDIYNFKVRPDDVWIVTFPRSGTTLTQEMIWLLANSLDYEKAASIPLTTRYPFLEFSCFMHEETKQKFLKENADFPDRCHLIESLSSPIFEELEKTTERRFIKTHLPLSLLPPNLLNVGCKVIYVARNPKDVAVSFYHLNRLVRTLEFHGDFSKYWHYFANNLQPWAPFWDHITEGWNKRNEPNLLFLFYEDIAKDLRGSILKMQSFLGTNYEDSQINTLENHLKIENFRKNSSVNFDVLKHLGMLKSGEQGFVRNGKTGGWQDYFTEQLNLEAGKWINENLLKTDLRFPTY